MLSSIRGAGARDLGGGLLACGCRACMRAFVRVCCACVHACVCACMLRVHACMCAFVRAAAGACMHASCVQLRIRASVRLCVRLRVRACVPLPAWAQQVAINARQWGWTARPPTEIHLHHLKWPIPAPVRTSRPGSYALMPSMSAFSMSMVPQMRSSVAPRGSSTCARTHDELGYQVRRTAAPVLGGHCATTGRRAGPSCLTCCPLERTALL